MSQALVVVDMLVDFMDPGGRLFCGAAARTIVPRVAELIEEARRDGTPVIFIADRHLSSDPEFAMFPPHCIAGTQGAEVVDELRPLPAERVIAKRRFSAFYGTDLDLTLRELGVDQLVLVGVCTNICILYTAADACMRHYRVVVPRDAVASFDEDAHGWALRQLETVLGATIV
ncbi:MAG: isochorismatase family cysteine hydrolase [Bacillota bacterium]